MPNKRVDVLTQSMTETMLYLHYKPSAISAELQSHPSVDTVRRMRMNLAMYGERYRPYQFRPGPCRKITTYAKEELLALLDREPWTIQIEMVMFLEEEFDIHVSRSTVSRLLKEWRISQKRGQRIGPRNNTLRLTWESEMKTMFTANQLVFVDESLFKQQTGWRCMAYAPIGDPARWQDDVRRGSTHSILPALTIDGYLPCTGVKEGF